ncbi:hypothetical protein FOQG_02064 [Fusarium oxysporum f. sp. raphani 54005]|uniref:Uncharacterized protein n=3 Tax=Fusarium oxysporum TaxID=5507 RepID=X0DQQ1_FUSOX|nr:hypothetical protein FOVG_15983 [Fusarium oxysporum f. sp. pisi HDV247]EXK96622.1 hypothetical protein FOQG_02064 [Fusarium oxysporum f. sp. raphani 54005]KAG7434990.1 hypothetical protein Forpi1262_v003807 [Fusarium oxysporum f. sp. raphani]KAJ4023735.1 hypothetical protein NW758_014738 [Fusarium oxysporum]KAJ4035046.1 hypothetical protein NW753_012241 [Fusarium oxysporum]
MLFIVFNHVFLSCDSSFATAKNLDADVSEVLRIGVEKLTLKHNETVEYLLLFMLITNTSFTVQEIAEIFSIDLHKRDILPTAINIPKFVSEHCSDFLRIRGGRNSVI